MKKLFVAVTGASGTIYAREFFRHLPYADWEVHAVVTKAARLVAEGEGGLNLPPQVHEWDEEDIGAPPSSGSSMPRWAIEPNNLDSTDACFIRWPS